MARRILLLSVFLFTLTMIAAWLGVFSEVDVSANQAPVRPTGCHTLDASKPPLSIALESTDYKVWSGDSYVKGILLRLRNNSDCAIILEAPPNEFSMYKIQNGKQVSLEVGEAKNNQRISLKYFIKYPKREYLTVGGFGGDILDYVKLNGGNSIFFSVPLKILREGGELYLPFQYEWESVDAPEPIIQKDGSKRMYKAVEHYLTFVPQLLPEKLLK